MAPNEAYQKLLTSLERVAHLEACLGILSWDEQVNLPAGAVESRAAQLSALSELTHREATRPQIGECLEVLEAHLGQLDDDQRVVVREARREYAKATLLPAEFVAHRTAARSRSYFAWTQAREADDFAAFAPHLAEQLKIAKEEAAILGFGERPYDYHIDAHDPGMTAAEIASLFERLRDGLRPLVDTILGSSRRPPALQGRFAVEAQKALAREVTERMGFDYQRGRMDVSVHPFCGGSADDVRLTTRYNEEDPFEALFGAMHEAGHGLYEQGLPSAPRGTGLAVAAGMGVHESQSRLWENQVGRSRSFWEHWDQPMRRHFGSAFDGLDRDDIHWVVNAVNASLIRTESDEVTYNLHIVLRFELEQALFSGAVDVASLPEAWNEASARILGFRPPSNKLGCLQDVHWSGGAFGYFPSYTLGNMLAAQLWEAVRSDIPDLDARIARGDYADLLAWLRRRVHADGRRYYLRELSQRATGKPLSPDALLAYLRHRYLPLYS